MILLFLISISAELNEKGYLYSVGREQFLSVEDNKVKTIQKSKMPKKFEIETRGGDSSYMLRIYPSPRNGENVMDKDWWYNDHKLIFYPKNDWQSQHFIFSMLPKNMLKIVVKERCAEVKDDGSVKASLCKSHKDNKKQYFRWIRAEDRRVVEAFVRKHGGYGRGGGDENLGWRRTGGGGRYGRGGRGGYDRDDDYDDSDRGGGRTPCYDDEDCEDNGGRFGYPGVTDDDFFRSRGSGSDGYSKRGRTHQMTDCELGDEYCDMESGYFPYRKGRGRGGRGYGRGGRDYDGRGGRDYDGRDGKRSPLAEAMCSDDIDEIGKIICEINRMPNLVI